MEMETVVIFGGSGFIGAHLTRQLVTEKLARKVVVADIAQPDLARFGFCKEVFSDERVVFGAAVTMEDMIKVAIAGYSDEWEKLAVVFSSVGRLATSAARGGSHSPAIEKLIKAKALAKKPPVPTKALKGKKPPPVPAR